MSDYTKTTNFSAKDPLPQGDDAKVVLGSEHDTEYDAIAVAVATKANKVSGGTTNNLIKQSSAGDLTDAGFLVTAYPVANIDLAGGTTETTVADDDEVAIYDTSATANRMMTRVDFLSTAMLDLFHLQDAKSSGTAAQLLTVTTWNKRTLASVTNEITGASVSSSVITLPAGTYYAEGSASCRGHASGNVLHKIRLRQTSATAQTLLIGTSDAVGSNTTLSSRSSLAGRFTLASAKQIELQHFPQSYSPLSGAPVSSGENEIYADLRIWKIAV